MLRVDTLFSRITPGGETSLAPAYFSTRPQDVDEVNQIDISSLVLDLKRAEEAWNARGSGFTLEAITKAVVCIIVNQPLHGSSYIVTPSFIESKHVVLMLLIMIKTASSGLSFPVYTHLRRNPQRVSKYKPFKDELKFGNLKMPLPVSQVPKFEELNPNIGG